MSALLETIVSNTTKFYQDIHTLEQESNLEESRRWCDAVRRGSIFFYATEEVEIGLKDIDWSGSHIKHQEWPAQLNRFFCLTHLSTCYEAEADIELARLSRMLIEDWIDHHDYSADGSLAPGDNTLNMSIRLTQTRRGGWWAAVARFNCEEVFDDAFVEKMVESTKGQLSFLRSNLSTHGNWRISQLDTLLTTSIILPDFVDHQQFAVRNLNEAFHRQIHEDGSHEEHNPSYHSWMCNVFTDLWRLAKARPELGLHMDTEHMARMWDYSLFSTSPDGAQIALHDGHRGLSGSKTGLAKLRETRRAVLDEAGLTGPEWDEDVKPSRAFLSAGQIFLRSTMDESADMISFDATRWGGAHCHLSRNAVTFYSGGRMLLWDPGVFNYEVSDPFMAYGKSTAAHNTLTIDYMNQSNANPDLHDLAILDDAAVISCSFEGGYFPGTYTWGWCKGRHPGVFARHTRTLLWVRDRFAIVWDSLQTTEAHRHNIHWQFPVGPAECDPDTGRAWTAEPEQRNILVQRLGGKGDSRVIMSEGCHAPGSGWLPGDSRGNHVPAPMAVYQGLVEGVAIDVTLLLPFDGTVPPAIGVTPFPAHDKPNGFVLEWDDGTVDHIIAGPELGRQIGDSGLISSDMSLGCITLKDGSPVHAIGYGGMYMEFDGRVIEDRSDTGMWSKTL